ncbi:MAG: DNA polymerase-3 subunit delta' [Maribacter sp.]
MTFKEIIGQTEVKQLLRNMVVHDRIPHAQIFLGNEGVGNLATAIAFAQYAMCSNPQEEEACGICSHCTKASKLIHPDIHFSYPVVGSKVISASFSKEWREAILSNPYMNAQQWLKEIKAENKQGNINKDECSAIVKKLSLKTFEGRYKILILWLPEFLGKEGNRLLKLIEEPPDDTLFILVAENAEAILNTILSRCQIMKFNPLSDEEVVGALLAKGVEQEKASGLAHLANGNLNQAYTLITEAENDNALLFLEWLRICYVGKAKDMIEWSDRFSSIGRESQKYFFDYGLFFIREYMVLKLTGNEHIRLNENELKTAKNLTKVIQYGQIEPIANILTDSAYHISRNANPKILMTDITSKMNRILRGKVQYKIT